MEEIDGRLAMRILITTANGKCSLLMHIIMHEMIKVSYNIGNISSRSNMRPVGEIVGAQCFTGTPSASQSKGREGRVGRREREGKFKRKKRNRVDIYIYFISKIWLAG